MGRSTVAVDAVQNQRPARCVKRQTAFAPNDRPEEHRSVRRSLRARHRRDGTRWNRQAAARPETRNRTEDLVAAKGQDAVVLRHKRRVPTKRTPIPERQRSVPQLQGSCEVREGGGRGNVLSAAERDRARSRDGTGHRVATGLPAADGQRPVAERDT